MKWIGLEVNWSDFSWWISDPYIKKKNLKRTLREFKVGDIMAKILEGCEDC